jgi:hypothetical protein
MTAVILQHRTKLHNPQHPYPDSPSQDRRETQKPASPSSLFPNYGDARLSFSVQHTSDPFLTERHHHTPVLTKPVYALDFS